MSLVLRFAKWPAFLRFIIAFGIACVFHQIFANFFFGPSGPAWSKLQAAFSTSNILLSKGPEALPFLMSQTAANGSSKEAVQESVSTNSSANAGLSTIAEPVDSLAAIHPPEDWHVAKLCLWGTWQLDAENAGLKCPAGTIPEHEGTGPTAFGYAILGRHTPPIHRAFFYVSSFPSTVNIEASLETMLRDLEADAFNDPGTSDVALKLCSGTRDVAGDGQCRVTAGIRQWLSTPGSSIDEQINRIRVRSLFVGWFQLFTLTIFVFAMLETGSLWIQWVAPHATLFVVKEEDGAIDRESVKNLSRDKLLAFQKSAWPSIGDRMFFQGLVAAAQQVRTDSAGKPATISIDYSASIVATFAAFRQHLLDEALGLVERLETLGDTMLKLAFMGTVFGISTALFSARGLDTADPVLRLLAKSQMYSAIGVGFGTTLTGIILSIFAAQARSVLYETWTGKIGRSFERLLDLGAEPLLANAVDLGLHENSEALTPGSSTMKRTKITIIEIVCWLVIVIGAVYAVLRLASIV